MLPPHGRYAEGVPILDVRLPTLSAAPSSTASAASDCQKIYAEDCQKIRAEADLRAFIEVTLGHVEHSIAANKRPDGLYHAYNLMTVAPGGGIEITYLPEMLEGQVAVLSSGQLNPS